MPAGIARWYSMYIYVCCSYTGMNFPVSQSASSAASMLHCTYTPNAANKRNIRGLTLTGNPCAASLSAWCQTHDTLGLRPRHPHCACTLRGRPQPTYRLACKRAHHSSISQRVLSCNNPFG